MNPSLHFPLCLDPRYKDRFFTNVDSAKHGKDALAKELDEDFRTTTTKGASQALEPPGMAQRVEAAAPGPSTSKSSSRFFKEFSKIRREHEEDPGASSRSRTAVQLQGYFSEETIPATDDPYKY